MVFVLNGLLLSVIIFMYWYTCSCLRTVFTINVVTIGVTDMSQELGKCGIFSKSRGVSVKSLVRESFILSLKLWARIVFSKLLWVVYCPVLRVVLQSLWSYALTFICTGGTDKNMCVC